MNAHVVFFLSAVVAWRLIAPLNLAESFYAYFRAHDEWDRHEIGVLIVTLSIALVLSLVHKSRQLRNVMREREHEHHRAERNARHDSLTGLVNRRAFAQTLERFVAKPQTHDRFIAMIDLDRFKPINTHQGHSVGDSVLQGVAARLDGMVGGKNTLARLGGDEFAIIFHSGHTALSVERIARRLLHAMEQPFVFQSHRLYVSFSVGLVNWTPDITPSQALGRVDKALAAAKDQGRARFAWYDAELDRASLNRAQIESDLRDAIRNDKIEPWFQPIVDMVNNRVTGFEVLARWYHPDRGFISPGVFIEIAEDSGQISALGHNLLKQACLAASEWEDDLSLSINVSALQFHDPSLVDNIKDILDAKNFDPRRLTIEITESSVIRDFQTAREKLEALKAIGISVALDDFGTGYSSLASLRQLPFDRIKIDHSFITDITRQPQNQKIVTGIMSLARGLDLDVTAEGIETIQDLQFVRSLNCVLGQGFLFDKAVPARDIPWLLETKWSDLHRSTTQTPDIPTIDCKTRR
ncbi:EAL domain-containing protein [Roseobacter sp.]|uniref:putative bifunctional diguanylate cyclase/phosphodiesterase n=1 Tax=Roseobacter sp. TaxID=1907202 RepID=UPI003297AC51